MQTEISNKRKCSICSEFKEIVNFEFRKDQGSYRSQCKPCVSEKRRLREFAAKGNETKQCSQCNRTLSVSNFRTRGGNQKNLLKSQCNDCLRNNHRAWVEKNPKRVEQYRKADEWTLFKRCQRRNISPDDLFKAIEAQDNKCPVCNQELGEITETAIDHNHDTGEFRGVLHKECNRGLGLLKDSPETLRRAARYLESTGYYGE